jgi:quinol-cytochrome oxidoreductase complex cytochrome b subunit
MSTSYGAGLAFGIVTALIIFALVWKFSKRSMKGTFDERQELVRGRGYKYACFTMLGLLVLNLLIESLDAFETLPVTRSLAIFIMILAGVMVYALYCIKNDSYFGVGTDTRTYRAVMWIVIVCNAISGFSGLREGAIEDGKLAFGPCASLLFCLAFVIIMISISVKQRNLAKEEAAEDDM